MKERYLFRAKRKDSGEWVFGGLSYCEKTGAYFITNMGKDHISYIGFHQEVDPETICQCTGLKDKNGNLIWENDIVSCEHEKYIGTTIDYDSLSKVSRQLNVSMGSMAYLLCAIAAMMSVVLIYLLTKTIIEKNAQSISMTKILGYTNHEVSSIYIVSTSIIVSLFILLTVPLDYAILKPIFEAMMKEEMAGWMPLTVSNLTFLKTIVIGFISYLIVMLIEYKKIKKIPMQDALKNVE